MPQEFIIPNNKFYGLAFLKFGLFIINPTISWVMAMTSTGAILTGFSDLVLTFGQESVSLNRVSLFLYCSYFLFEQLLSIFTTILPIWTLVSLG